jgi:hypothetical protein
MCSSKILKLTLEPFEVQDLIIQYVPQRKHDILPLKIKLLILFKGIIAVCCESLARLLS